MEVNFMLCTRLLVCVKIRVAHIPFFIYELNYVTKTKRREKREWKPWPHITIKLSYNQHIIKTIIENRTTNSNNNIDNVP